MSPDAVMFPQHTDSYLIEWWKRERGYHDLTTMATGKRFILIKDLSKGRTYYEPK